MKKFKSTLKEFWSDESGQGTAEYVLLIAMVAGAFMIFKGAIIGWFKDNVTKVTGDLTNAIQ